MDPILDSVLSEIIHWRLQYLEDTETDDQEFEHLKKEYLKVSLHILRTEKKDYESEVDLADCLYSIFENAKEMARSGSKHIHKELDSVLSSEDKKEEDE